MGRFLSSLTDILTLLVQTYVVALHVDTLAHDYLVLLLSRLLPLTLIVP